MKEIPGIIGLMGMLIVYLVLWEYIVAIALFLFLWTCLFRGIEWAWNFDWLSWLSRDRES